MAIDIISVSLFSLKSFASWLVLLHVFSYYKQFFCNFLMSGLWEDQDFFLKKKHNNFIIIKLATVTTIKISNNKRSYFCFWYRYTSLLLWAVLTSLFDELLLSLVPSSSCNIRTTTGSSVNTEKLNSSPLSNAGSLPRNFQ